MGKTHMGTHTWVYGKVDWGRWSGIPARGWVGRYETDTWVTARSNNSQGNQTYSVSICATKYFHLLRRNGG